MRITAVDVVLFVGLCLFSGVGVCFWLDPKTHKKDHACEENA
jgi:hypothetical protein